MKEFNILPKPEGYTYDYDPSENPGVLNEFATAVYRFHTLIQVNLHKMFLIRIESVEIQTNNSILKFSGVAQIAQQSGSSDSNNSTKKSLQQPRVFI